MHIYDIRNNKTSNIGRTLAIITVLLGLDEHLQVGNLLPQAPHRLCVCIEDTLRLATLATHMKYRSAILAILILLLFITCC